MLLPISQMAPVTVIHYLQEQGGTPGNQSPDGSLGCRVVALNRHIPSILKDFLSMVFFMVLSFTEKISP